MPYKITDKKSDDPRSKGQTFIQGYCDHCGAKTQGVWTSDPAFRCSSFGSRDANHKDPFDCIKHLREQISEIARLNHETQYRECGPR